MSTGESRFAIRSESDVVYTVVRCTAICESLGFDSMRAGLIATAVSELARNIFKYTPGGEVVLRPIRRGHLNGVEVVAEDRGPGIEDLEQAVQEHFSSGGTLGLGLPGVKRIMDEFELASEPGRGTTVTARKWLRRDGLR